MEKIARICWNSNGWKRPSGSVGKSRLAGTYENEVGFGHEEWLLDDSKILPDGYHYAFLEPMNVASGKHIGAVYDIHLFAITPRKQRVYIGCLHNCVGVSRQESKQVYAYYKKQGWIKEMREDIIYAGGKVKDMTPEWMFNVKFKFSEAEINYPNPPILKAGTLASRYNLMDKKVDFEFELDEDNNVQVLDTSDIYRVTQSGEIVIDPMHKKIQNAIAQLLKDDYVHLYLEDPLNGGQGQKIDMKGLLKNSDEWHYYEIKTDSAKQSIREALGQILEYDHYPSTTRAAKLFIVGPEKPDESDCKYMQLLREKYGSPVWFRWYSFEENKLYEGI